MRAQILPASTACLPRLTSSLNRCLARSVATGGGMTVALMLPSFAGSSRRLCAGGIVGARASSAPRLHNRSVGLVSLVPTRARRRDPGAYALRAGAGHQGSFGELYT